MINHHQNFFSFKPASFEKKQLILSLLKSICKYLMPHCIDIVSIITQIVNLSLNTGIFHNEFKFAFVKRLLKKSTIDSDDL